MHWMVIVLLSLLLRGDSCRRNDDETQPRDPTVTLSEAEHLWPLAEGDGFYQLWLGVPASTPPDGTDPWDVAQAYTPVAAFRVDPGGATLDLDGVPRVTWPVPDTIDASALARARITYEPSGSTPPDPLDPFARFILAAGAFVAPGATITTEATASDAEVSALDLSSFAGSFQLISPTTPNPNDESLGLWFLTGSSPGFQPSLVLPPAAQLPADRVYEGWIFRRDITTAVLELHSSGRFRRADLPDDDAGGAGQGPDPLPSVPGQEFHATLDLALDQEDDWEVMVTLEPEPDPSPGVPTGLWLLRGVIGRSAPAQTDLPLSNVAVRNEIPGITVQVRR